MAKLRRNYTLQADNVDFLERYADRFFNGNQSAAADHLFKIARQSEQKQTTEGLVYAGIGITSMLLISLIPWLV